MATGRPVCAACGARSRAVPPPRHRPAATLRYAWRSSPSAHACCWAAPTPAPQAASPACCGAAGSPMATLLPTLMLPCLGLTPAARAHALQGAVGSGVPSALPPDAVRGRQPDPLWMVLPLYRKGAQAAGRAPPPLWPPPPCCSRLPARLCLQVPASWNPGDIWAVEVELPAGTKVRPAGPPHGGVLCWPAARPPLRRCPASPPPAAPPAAPSPFSSSSAPPPMCCTRATRPHAVAAPTRARTPKHAPAMCV